MTVTRTDRLIQQLKEHPPDRSGEIRLTDGGLEIRVQLADWDRLGCLLEGLEMQHAQTVRRACDPLHIVDKVTYLGETLKLIEVDADGGRAILRSFPPCVCGGSVSFFELVLDRTRGLSLTRQTFDRQQGERRRVAAPLTRHVLERLLVDLVDCVATKWSLPEERSCA